MQADAPSHPEVRRCTAGVPAVLPWDQPQPPMMNPLRVAARLSSAPLIMLAFFTTRAASAQNLTGTIVVRVTADSIPLPGAAVATGTANTVTDQAGLAAFKVSTGRHMFRVTPAGFRPESLAVFVGVGTTRVTIPVHRTPVTPAARVVAAPPAVAPSPVPVLPAAAATAPPPASPAHVAAKRDDRRSTDAPTFVEVSDREAVDEQLDRSPGNISDLLGRFTGVRVQPLSAGSGGVGIRIRGMPGRYAKILTDGLPLFGATPEGQDPLQMPVLGLDRVEVFRVSRPRSTDRRR